MLRTGLRAVARVLAKWVASKGREEGVRGGVEAEGCHQEAQTESGGAVGMKRYQIRK